MESPITTPPSPPCRLRPGVLDTSGTHSRITGWPAALLVALVGAALAGLSEHIPLASGSGWDGQFYVRAAKDFVAELRAGVDPYRLQRMAPAVAVHAGLRMVGAATASDASIILGFQTLNWVCLTGAAVLWGRIAQALRLCTPAFWLGIVGLFANYAMLKMAPYYPVLNDVPAFFLGTAACWAFVTDRPLVLLAVGAVGAFTWPVAAPIVVLLLVFPRKPIPEMHRATAPWPAALVAAALAVAVVATFVRVYFVQGIAVVGMGPVVPVYRPLALVGLAGAAAYVAVVTYGLLRPFAFTQIPTYIRAMRPGRLVAAVALLVGPALIIRGIARGEPYLSASQFWNMLVVLGSGRPLIAPVSHVAYFGPVLLLLVPLWRPYVRVIHSWGIGATLAALATALVALGPESRQSIFALPFIIAPLCVAANAVDLPGRFVAVIAGLAVATSQFWLTINTSSLQTMADPSDAVRTVYARYFMNQGPYMTNTEYVGHVLSIAALTAAVAGAWRHYRRS